MNKGMKIVVWIGTTVALTAVALLILSRVPFIRTKLGLSVPEKLRPAA